MLASFLPTKTDLDTVFLHKHGKVEEVGWSPRRRYNLGYFLPADHYEGVVANLVQSGCRWIDVGGGHDIFPENPKLARELVARCGHVAGIDPSENIHDNPFVHEKIQGFIEDYQAKEPYDLATLRMVAEHISNPPSAIQSLNRLLKSGGQVVVFTVNLRTPLATISRVMPFSLHNPVKKLFWGSEEKDTFPVCYRMNTRRKLKQLFEEGGFKETSFAYLDDLSTFGRFKYFGKLELAAWRAMNRIGLRYPENCLLGVYTKVA